MIGMRMIETHNLQAALVGLTLDRHKLFDIDVVAILRAVGTGVTATDYIFHHTITVTEASQKRAATFAGVRLFTVPAQRFVLTIPDNQHACAPVPQPGADSDCAPSQPGL